MGDLALVVQTAATEHAQTPALVAPGRDPLVYERLPRLVGGLTDHLRECGVGAEDRVALVVGNGPEAATAFLSLACAATCAPLNPAYSESELAFYLDDLKARAVVVGSTVEGPVRDVASARGIAVLELETVPDAPAGLFRLDGALRESNTFEPRESSDTALVLHTSGTTSRPKLVPLTHGNLSASARNVAETLRLEPGDVCLNVMPLFHVHGLVAALLSSLHSGATVGCTPGFHPFRVFEWIRELQPTWYTAVPTMHQVLVARSGEHRDVLDNHRLRFARSSSAALPTSVLAQLEDLLRVPVLEAYGMTEAAHQIASNRLPPERRVAGAVGQSAGPDIAVLGPGGEVLPAGELGEVAIRGENVFGGYEANPEANEAAFVDGWFRTGDEGTINENGDLRLHARIKEIINRGGEKIAPAEVDERLLAHPTVSQAVTFAIPHPLLGEEVGAAVVLEPDLAVDAAALQAFVGETLAPFKVPRQIVFVPEIPKGPTGKTQRIGLAERLAVGTSFDQSGNEGDAPESLLERELAFIWSAALGDIPVGRHDDFFALGGDSILGAEAIARTRELMGRHELPITAIVRAPSVAAMARLLEGDFPELAATGAVPLQLLGSGSPLFLVHGSDGEMIRFGALARELGDVRPVYALRAKGIAEGWTDQPCVEELADEYLTALRVVQPEGPYLLGGFCFGATVAVEMTHRLQRAGETVERLILIDPRFARPADPRYALWLAWRRACEGRLLSVVRGRITRRFRHTPGDMSERVDTTEILLDRARDAYRATPVHAPSVAIFSTDYSERYALPEWYIRGLLPGRSYWGHVPAGHSELFRHPGVYLLAQQLRAGLAPGSSVRKTG